MWCEWSDDLVAIGEVKKESDLSSMEQEDDISHGIHILKVSNSPLSEL